MGWRRGSRVDVTLTEPDANGHSILTVTDDAPKGWENISHAYTLYAESTKTNDPTKRGRFNEGEKAVVCLNIEAAVKTVSGCIRFEDQTRFRSSGAYWPNPGRLGRFYQHWPLLTF
jgi:hypothetical protein